MKFLIITLVVIALIAIANKTKSSSNRKRREPKGANYKMNTECRMEKETGNTEKKRPQFMDKFRLLNRTEQKLFEMLKEAAPRLHIFVQVSMSQILHINTFKKGGKSQLGTIGRKSLDFVLCRPEDTSILVAIEYNGPTHERKEQRISDETKATALDEAGIPLIVIQGEIPDAQTLRRLIAPHMVERRINEAERNERIGKQKTSP